MHIVHIYTPPSPPTHRFGGDTFPPVVLFKIFTSTSSQSTIGGVAGGGVQYISGKRLIKPASEAAEDSRRQMGNRKFYDQMLLDACHHHQLKVTEETDVTTMKEYMQYAANVDESPAYLGGKENTWRKLNLDGQCVCVCPIGMLLCLTSNERFKWEPYHITG